MIIHPQLIKNFSANHRNKNLSIKYVRTKSYQYLVCKGNISQEFESGIRKFFPEAYATNGNKIIGRTFRLNP